VNFTLQDLGLAYRKAKVDLYYSTNSSLLAIAEYESQLTNKLQSLLDKLNGGDEQWITAPEFLGNWTLVPKGIDLKGLPEPDSGLIFASPAEEWEYICERAAFEKKKPKAEFRLMAHCSLDFHVLSALWMLKVGHQYDKKLSGSAYGSRLRRTEKDEINSLSMGSFKPYLKPFRDWRDGGIKAMHDALAAKKKVVALTADVSSFYHELQPGFMLNQAFNRLVEVELAPEEQILHRLFITALEAWAQMTPLKKGLPVGLPASAVVANTALIELDRLIEQQVAPLYYGRYVDDIMLVMENGGKFRSTADLWEWLFARFDGKLAWVGSEKKEIQFQPDYLRHGETPSRIRFANDKNKVFLLEGETGQTLVDSIAHQIHQRASEWRALPNLPPSPRHVGTDLVAATQTDGEAADNLRKASALTMRRAGFAIKLRDFEAYERDLPPDAWKKHRHAFFDAFIQHVLVLPQYFELANYLPRVIRLATACEDFEYLSRIIRSLNTICATVSRCCDVGIKACLPEGTPEPANLQAHWEYRLFSSVYESVLAAFPPHLSRKGKVSWQKNTQELWLTVCPGLIFSDYWADDIKSMQATQARLFAHDLAHMPLRFIGLPKEMISQRGIPPRTRVHVIKAVAHLVPENVIDGIAILAKWIRFNKGMPLGLLFATRPFGLAELFVLTKDPFAANSYPAMQSVVLALRGFRLNEKMPQRDKHHVLQIPDGEARPKHAIAVSSWKTTLDSWTASVMRMLDPDLGRYGRLTHLINGLISQPNGARYFILPELALPAHWFLRVALKLQGRGISLITGIEYLHASKGRVRNQVWAALSHDGLGFPSTMIYRQDKQRPALHEEKELHRVAGREMQPDKSWKTPPIIQHGDFHFALLVCSELTNISYRAALRGQVDALFVPEWNQDTKTFHALVESAALDIHAYIIQCNDRQYGDSRIRAPSKDSWRRDVLRVKGGINDYCVIGVIDVHALRRFQSSYRSPDGPFKPVPDGFVINHSRKALPAGEAE
jgi:hypothetical protein